MPLTPLHMGIAWLIFLARPRRLSFLGITVGVMIPDVEVPVLYLLGVDKVSGHGAMHSILGAITLDLFLAMVAVFFVLPSIIGCWESKFGGRWVHFAGVDVSTIDRVPVVVSSGMIGIALHLGLDFLTHDTMPYLWPSTNWIQTFSIAGEWWWHLIVNSILAVLTFGLLLRYLGKMDKIRSNGDDQG